MDAWRWEAHWEFWQRMLAPEPEPETPAPLQGPVRREVPTDRRALRGLDQVKS
jgi:hypothetical protein